MSGRRSTESIFYVAERFPRHRAAPVNRSSSGRTVGVGLDVLHVPFTYFPHPVGGTETYVAGLVRALRPRGVMGAVAAPGEIDAASEHDGMAVFRFAGSPRSSLDAAYGAPDESAAKSFSTLLGRIQPKLVHIHARSAAVSERLVDVAHDNGAKVVFTYHTPTVSCVRGTMMWMGLKPCDGELHVRRCTSCTLQSHGVPMPVSRSLAAVPQSVGEALGWARLAGGTFIALRMSALVGASHRRFQVLMDKVDHVVAVSDWVAEVLRANGVPPAKMTLCRQGVDTPLDVTSPSTPRDARTEPNGPLRIGYFGRIDPTKGVDILIKALRRAPDVPVHLGIHGVLQSGSEGYEKELRGAAASDPRVSIHPGLPPERVARAMRTYDLIAVPSRGLETGPLVVLEAFAAGTPVIGARLGGIAELVADGVNGVLAEPDDPGAWATVIRSLAADRDEIARLRNGVRAPRSMDDVACEMAAVYQTVLRPDEG